MGVTRTVTTNAKDKTMTTTTKQVRATYLGRRDLGAPCFSVRIPEWKPESTARNSIIFRSQVGEDFEIGSDYMVMAKIHDRPAECDVVAVIGRVGA